MQNLLMQKKRSPQIQKLSLTVLSVLFSTWEIRKAKVDIAFMNLLKEMIEEIS